MEGSGCTSTAVTMIGQERGSHVFLQAPIRMSIAC